MSKQITQQEKWDKLMGAYKYVFNSPEGQVVLKDLSEFSGMTPDPEGLKEARMTHMAGADLTHAQCAYRNGMQDLFRYVESYVAD